MMKLGDAMRKVAGGDFSVRLDCSSRMRDVREVYGSFNTMVKELGNTETLQTDFVSNVSHEFKTPINAIEGYASLLQDTQLTDEQKNAYIDKIIFNTRRLVRPCRKHPAALQGQQPDDKSQDLNLPAR